MKVNTKKFKWRRAADKNGPKELLCLLLSPSTTSASLFHRKYGSSQITWTKAEANLPPFRSDTDNSELVQALKEKQLRAQYACVVSQLDGVLQRLVNFAGRPGSRENLAQMVKQTMGTDAEHEVSFKVVREAPSTSETPDFSVLASSMPISHVKKIREFLESLDIHPVSLTMGTTAAPNLVQQLCRGERIGTKGYLHINHRISQLYVFNGDELILIREFKTGKDQIIQALMDNIGLDEDTTQKLYHSGSFDIGGEIVSTLKPWLHQISISMDFCERRFGSRVDMVNLFGSGANSRAVESTIHEALGCPTASWEPLQELEHFNFADESVRERSIDHLLSLSEALRYLTKRKPA